MHWNRHAGAVLSTQIRVAVSEVGAPGSRVANIGSERVPPRGQLGLQGKACRERLDGEIGRYKSKTKRATRGLFGALANALGADFAVGYREGAGFGAYSISTHDFLGKRVCA